MHPALIKIKTESDSDDNSSMTLGPCEFITLSKGDRKANLVFSPFQ